MNDFKFALRQLLKSPGFSALAILTLALGIGLNTAIFSLINDLFVRGLPFEKPQNVVHISAAAERGTPPLPLGAPRFQFIRDAQTVFTGFAAETGAGGTFTGLGDAFTLPFFRVTSNYFDVLGVKPILGRTFLPKEEEGADVAIVSEHFWQTRLGGDPNVLSRPLTIDGVPHTLVGVIPNMSVKWVGPNANTIWTTKPFSIPGFSYERMMRGTGFLRAIGRLKPGVSLTQARAATETMVRNYATQLPDKIDAKYGSVMKTLPEDVTEEIRPAFATLLAAVGFVLLIACSNVANLLLVRFTGRRREISLRMALGASRASVLRLFVCESVLISLLAGLIGLFLAVELVPLVPKLAANFLPLEANSSTGLSVPVLAFTIGLALVTGLAMGVYPALQSSRADLVDGLKEGGRGTSGSVRQQRFRKILVGAQVALSVMLLAGAALLISSFIRLSHQDVGFRADHTWVGFVNYPNANYPDIGARARFADQVVEKLRNTPGIESAAASGDFPLVGGAGLTLYARGDREVPPIPQRAAAPSHDVAPGYFKSWGIPILNGRDFDQRDIQNHTNVVIISKAGAKKLYGDENPLGKILVVTSNATPCEIIGVVGDVRGDRLNLLHDMEFYRPWAQENFPFMTIAVRSPQPLETVTRTVQSALNALDPTIAVAQPQTMDTVMAQALGQARLMMWLLGVFAGVALLLATVGIYGAVAYSVAQRTGEIGVRMALGAQTEDVLRLILRQGMFPVVCGLGIGIVAALALGRLIASQLYQTSTFNPILLGGTLLVLATAALAACFVPARRATLINPIQALRTE